MPKEPRRRTNKSTKRSNSMPPEAREQRQALGNLREELTDLHIASLLTMSEQGILPPLYGGEHLGEDREALPLWGFKDGDDAPQLGALMLRIMPGIEPDPDLEMSREELGLTNEWPIAELLDSLKLPDGTSAIEDSEDIRDLSMLFLLMGDHVQPAPGYDREAMNDAMSEMRPYAVLPIIPVDGEGEDVTYRWETLEDFRAEVVYADTPQLLEAAVWEYRLNHALATIAASLKAEGKKPDTELMATNAAGLAALYEIAVMHSTFFYGTTSPIRTRQEELDVLREENGDLIIKAPLKPSVEPIPLLAEDRQDINAIGDDTILYLASDSPMLQSNWPRVRAKRFFRLRMRFGLYGEDKNGELKVKGFASEPIYEWQMADTLPALYRQSRLSSIYEMLCLCGLIDGKPGQEDDPANLDPLEDSSA